MGGEVAIDSAWRLGTVGFCSSAYLTSWMQEQMVVWGIGPMQASPRNFGQAVCYRDIIPILDHNG